MNIILNSIFRRRTEVTEADKRRFIQLALVLGVLLTGLYALGANNEPGHTYFSGWVAFSALLMLSFLPVSLAWLTHSLLAVALLSGFALAMQSGGIYSPTLLWLAIIPNLALFVLSQQATLLWVLFVMTILGLTGQLTDFQEVATADELRQTSGLWATLHLVGAQLCVMLIHWVHDWQYRQKSARIDASMKRMKAVKKHLELTEAYKDSFITHVSEDLRGPMNAILGYSDVLADMAKYKPGLTDTVQHIRSSIQQLLELTNSILDHAQLIEGKLKLTFKPVSLRQMMEEKWAHWTVKDSVQFKVVVDPSIPEWLWCDPHRLRQIIGILLSNAQKFTHQGQVKLAFSYAQQQLQIDIFDTGIGISEEVKAHIFKRFEQADGPINPAFGGIGLGLPNALELTRLFGGTIGFESDANQGSHFWVKLPISAYRWASELHEAKPTLSAMQACKLLVVDDQAVSMLVTMQTLRRLMPHAELACAASGQEAIAHVMKHPVDLVLMDVWMPEMDGPSTCRQLRQAAPHTTAPWVIGLTASTHPKDRLRCLDAGMHDVIVKPLDPEHVHKVISRALQEQQALGLSPNGGD